VEAHAPRLGQRGFSYVEILVSVVLVALALVPALEGLRAGTRSSHAADDAAADQRALRAKLEEVMAEPVARLDAAAQAAGGPATASAYSDGVTPGIRQRLVFLSRYDGDNLDGDGDGFTGTDAGLIWIEVRYAEGPGSLASLVTW
jgi:type II secretory pathway pseudopilin PulG